MSTKRAGSRIASVTPTRTDSSQLELPNGSRQRQNKRDEVY